MFRGLIVLLAVTSVAMAAVYIQQLEEKPEKFKDVPGCYISEIDEVIPVGGSAPSKSSCKQYNCNEDNVQVFTCGAIKADPPCTLTTDPSQDYPDCCPKPVCPQVQPPPSEPTSCN
ncbi:U-megalopygitoxin(1)-Mo1-like [Epargyreus clarus]|uniref:U-megalopygitoxin(1)-Mo1-like n=1 Tax=Epargyreus clarus TaxID=520877 RepID=UPI003C30A86D